ncbi:metallopeptidase MepB [Vararia minispora EC-137]|uniref:Metallopeptidase MepB n=1 Tax=Vararia minispora EC-137 TaxID=1314806 RepID=A0ACB8QF30_9AGAM|nr:metallopeptidase MepB [Vararia minispora EC-137]
MRSLVPPQPPPKWTHTAEEIKELTDHAIAAHRVIQDTIATLKPEECTLESLALAEGNAILDNSTEPLCFYQNVSPSKDLRDASNAAEIKLRDYAVESSMRVDVFAAKTAAQKNIKASGHMLTQEEERLVDKMILDGKRAGLALPEAKRTVLTDLKKQLSQVTLEFSKNANEENGHISFTLEELKGVPKDVISGYKKRAQDGRELYDVTHKTPDIFPVFKYADDSVTRQRAHESYESRLAINVPLLEMALELRRKLADLLGYPTWADFITEEKMVKSAKNVRDFLDDLEQRLRPLGVKERQTLLGLKAEDCEDRGIPFDGEFMIWDYRYYDNKFVEKSLKLDDALLTEYFPVVAVVPTILEVYQNLLSVYFEPIDAERWHSDVQAFAVWENDATDESGFVGYCYLDLYPREFKYGHAAVWPLSAGYTSRDGRRYPVAAMVANLAKPSPDRPALLRHSDVVTFFHEFGHAVHTLLSKTRFARFHGTAVARDFVEAPSQMLENWCWEPHVLARISSHYERKEPLSPELVNKVVKSRYVNVGLFYLRQLFFAKFDLKVHTDHEAEDYTALWSHLRETVSLVKGGVPGSGQGSFGHIVGGYDAGYYGYTYSLVFAADMYATVFKVDPLDPSRGARYRKSILEPGGSREEHDSLKEFLGRPANSEAFMRELFGSEAKL